RDAEVFAATGRACREVGWVFRRTAGPGAVLAANVRWLAGYRHRRCYRGEVAGLLAGVFAEPKPLMAGAREAGDPVGVLPVLYHLLWKQVLSADVIAGLLGPGSVVSVKQEGTGW
ncbi:MAG TPA: TnsA-like heteromeric transposase endonuclease subunit, partial [Streptosporangiaceae bacterium]|nr:TnsA-like heteromeric transposase endonuclease subunit [Streptosporangiaceae bacterium]